jgi:Mg2+ and Co2+ transporter CorA
MYALLDAIVDMFFVYVNHAKREVSDIDNLVFDLSEREQSDLLRYISLSLTLSLSLFC